MPLCNDCKVSAAEGIFCSEICLEKFRNFQSRVATMGGLRSGFSILGFLRSTIIAAVLIAVIYGILYFWLGTGDPGEMWTKLLQMFKLAH